MQLTDGFEGVRCLDCDATFAPDGPNRCGECGGALEPVYDDAALSDAHDRLLDDPSPTTGLTRFAAVLPFPAAAIPTVDEGATPTVDCPTLAEGAGVDTVSLKDEARNATGGITDREMAVAVAAATQREAEEVALPTTGNAGHSAAAYAARAGLDSTSFVPSRATFETKAMINVHGGEMNVVGGRYGDAAEAFESASEDEEWYSLAPFGTPFRHEGAKTIAYELAADDGTPDAVVHPTAHGTGLLGLYRGFRELASTGAIDAVPQLYAAQPEGCAPIVDAWNEDSDEITPVEHPDTIAGALEIPDPAGGTYVLDALAETDGGAVAVDDKDLLEAGTTLSQDGVPVSATGATAVAGLDGLAESGAFDAADSVVLVNPATANREADILRSHLMSKGI